MSTAGPHQSRDRSGRWPVIALAALTAVAIGVGFVVLPSAQADYRAQGLWASVCRAAGVPSTWRADPARPSAPPSTHVVLDRAMTAPVPASEIGRGATLALNCTMCHGARGVSDSEAPDLAGQQREVLIKQLQDFKGGQRTHPAMQILARQLSEQDILELAAYFSSLPAPRAATLEGAPPIVRVGAPLRNIAPCAACHEAVDRKLGAPRLDGLPREYIAAQLVGFRNGSRHNDSHAQMRNMARGMTSGEIADVADFYARRDR
jgi:cytochrome c553